MHRLEQCSRRECMELIGIPNRITNDILEEHVLFIFDFSILEKQTQLLLNF